MTQYVSSILYNVSGTYRVFKDKFIEYITKENEYKPVERMFPTNSALDQTATFFGAPSHIIDNITLGSAFNSANYNHLTNNKIDIIINVTNEIQNYFPSIYKDGTTYFKFGIYDTNEDDIEKVLEDIINVLRNNKDKNIFIHCYMGFSRSAICVIYYLMVEYKMTFDDAVLLVKEKRPLVNPNTSFVKVLKDKETQDLNDIKVSV
jgi:protein-tyrosine phosphatase